MSSGSSCSQNILAASKRLALATGSADKITRALVSSHTSAIIRLLTRISHAMPIAT